MFGSHNQMANLLQQKDLPNWFQVSQFVGQYDSAEVIKLSQKYSERPMDAARAIQKLLNGLLQFLNATHPDFQVMRSKNKLDHAGLFAAMNGLIETHRTKYSAMDADLTEQEYKVHNDALNYCATAIQNRLIQLRSNDDPIADFYVRNPNLLKNLIDEISPPASQPVNHI